MKRKMCEMKNLKNGDGYRVISNCKAQTFKKIVVLPVKWSQFVSLSFCLPSLCALKRGIALRRDQVH